MDTRNKTRRHDADRRLQSGIAVHFTGSKPISFAGFSFKAEELSKLIQSAIDASDVSEAAKRSWLATVVRANEAEAKVGPVRTAFRAYVVGLFGSANPALADFGIKPKKARKVTVKTKVQALEKTVATRKARHTMGKRQKKEITAKVIATSDGTPSAGASSKESNGGARVVAPS